MKYIEGRSRSEIAQATGRAMTTIDYHIGEAKRLVGVDISKVKTDVQSLLIPVALDSIATIAKTMSKHDPKYVDAAIKFLRNAGYTIETQELNVNHKDTSSPDQSFESVMQRFKSRSVDADIIDEKQAENSDQSSGESQPGQPGINAPATDQLESTSDQQGSTPTSISKSDCQISPLPQSHTKNPKSDQESPRSDIPLKPMSRDEDYWFADLLFGSLKNERKKRKKESHCLLILWLRVNTWRLRFNGRRLMYRAGRALNLAARFAGVSVAIRYREGTEPNWFNNLPSQVLEWRVWNSELRWTLRSQGASLP